MSRALHVKRGIEAGGGGTTPQPLSLSMQRRVPWVPGRHSQQRECNSTRSIIDLSLTIYSANTLIFKNVAGDIKMESSAT